MTAQEMLKEVEAEEALNQRGFFKEECKCCRGLGYLTILAGQVMPKCWTCRGDGKVWVKKP